MNGYETKELRTAHIKALLVELDGLKRSIPGVTQQIKDVPEDQIVERAQREQDLVNLKQRIEAVEGQLRLFKGETPHKRASKRSEQPGVEKR